MGKPLPIPSEDTAYFWERCRTGELCLQRCRDCGRAQFYPGAVCRGCLSAALEWVRAGGRGEVYSYTVVHRAPTADFQADVPYVVAVIELAEGVRLVSQVVGCPAGQVRIGMPVEVVFERASDEIMLPKFRPAGARATDASSR